MTFSPAFDDFLNILPYTLVAEDKEKLLTDRLKGLTLFHQENCPEYRAILNAIGFDINTVGKLYRPSVFIIIRHFNFTPSSK